MHDEPTPYVPALSNKGTTMNKIMQAGEDSIIDPNVRVGHVHLKVADIERSLAFYCGVLGFSVSATVGYEAVFLAAGGYHHHIALNTWESRGGAAPAPGTTGLFHVALLYPDRAALAQALRRALASGISIDGARDHGVSEAIYLRDPDGNGIELTWDRPQDAWPRTADGALIPFNDPLDVAALAAA
jgi:catechol 2,3-dioxygenase